MGRKQHFQLVDDGAPEHTDPPTVFFFFFHLQFFPILPVLYYPTKFIIPDIIIGSINTVYASIMPPQVMDKYLAYPSAYTIHILYVIPQACWHSLN